MPRVSPSLRVIGCLLIVALCFLPGCNRDNSHAESIPVKTTLVTSAANTSTQIYSGAFVPRVRVDLAFSVGGYVQEIRQLRGSDGRVRWLQEGDRVSKGTVLARVRLLDYQSRVQQAQAQINGQQAVNQQARYGEQLSVEQLNRARIALIETTAASNRSLAAISEAKAGLSAAKHQVDEAVSAADLATIEYNRAKRLYDSKALPKAGYDAAKTRYDVAKTQVEQARSQVDARQAQVEQAEQVYAATKASIEGVKTQIRSAETQVKQAKAQISASSAAVSGAKAQMTQASLPLDDALLKAPMDGVILKRITEVGNLAAPGVPCFIFADMSSMKAVFGVPDTELRNLRLGQPVDIETQSLPGKHLTGVITSIASDADPASRVYPIEVTVRNPSGIIKSGMIAKLVLREHTSDPTGLAVPLDSVIPAPGRPKRFAVYTVERNGSEAVARLRTVTVGGIAGDGVVVLSGLLPGDQVVSSGTGIVHDGARVSVVR